MKKAELQSAGCLMADTIAEAAGQYKLRDFVGTKDDIIALLKEMIVCNGKENTYFDFYYGTLSDQEKQRLHTYLTKDEADILERMEFSDNREDVYFAYEESLFEIALKLSLENCLFSTFYFAVTRETVWSNYDCRFLIFSQKEEVNGID